MLTLAFFLILTCGSIGLHNAISFRLNKSRIDAVSLTAETLAQQGMNYAYLAMSQTYGWAWFTHQVNLKADHTPNSNPPSLIPRTIRPTIPDNLLAKSDNSGFVKWGDEPGGSSDYYLTIKNLPANQSLKVITYEEWTGPNNTSPWRNTHILVIRALATVDNVSKAYEWRIAKRSLYDFFMFYATYREPFGGWGTVYDGAKFGIIHVNADTDAIAAGQGIALQWPITLKNLKGLSTSGYIRQWDYDNGYLCPYVIDGWSAPYWTSTARDGLTPIPMSGINLYSTQLATGMGYALEDVISNDYMRFQYNGSGKYGPDPYKKIWQQDGQPDIALPYYLEGDDAQWQWLKYRGWTHDQVPGGNEQTIRYVVPDFGFQEPNPQQHPELHIDISDAPKNADGTPAIGKIKDSDPEWNNYWKAKHRQFWAYTFLDQPYGYGLTSIPANMDWNNDTQWQALRPPAINKEWWDDLQYGDDRVNGTQDYALSSGTESDNAGGEYNTVQFLNTLKQPNAWKQWLKDNNLEGVIQDHNTGCPEPYKPVEINTPFKDLAQTGGGQYIGVTQDGTLQAGSLSDAVAIKDFWSPTQATQCGGTTGITCDAACDTTIAPDLPGDYGSHFDGLCKTKYVEIDVGKLTDKVNNGQLSNFNGVVYVEDLNDNDITTHDFSVVLKNGTTLPASGLTIVTPHNIYLYGDYNTTLVGGKVPPASVISSNRKIYTASNAFTGFDTGAEDKHPGQVDFASSPTFPYKPFVPVNYPIDYLSAPAGYQAPDNLFSLGTSDQMNNFLTNGTGIGTDPMKHLNDNPADFKIGQFQDTDNGKYYIAVKDTQGHILAKKYDSEPTHADRIAFITNGNIGLQQLSMYYHRDDTADLNNVRTYFFDARCDLPKDAKEGNSAYFTNAGVDSTYNTALVSPYEPTGYTMERGGNRTETGALVQLPANQQRKVASQAPYSYLYGTAPGGGWSIADLCWSGGGIYAYQPSFANPADLRRPPGDFSATSTSSWREFPAVKFKQL